MSALDLCKPSLKQDICSLCRRYAPHMPSDPMDRPHTLLLDASTLSELESCPMFAAKAVGRHWQVERESALEAA